MLDIFDIFWYNKGCKGVVCTRCGEVNILIYDLALSEMTRLICDARVGLVLVFLRRKNDVFDCL